MAVISVRLSEERGTGTVRRVVSFRGDGLALVQGQLWFSFEGEVPPEPGRPGDAAAVALVFMAMRSAHDLHVHGAVSRRLLANLEEFQEAWCRWRPKVYSRVGISADKEVDNDGQADDARAVALFSGGVDGSFTLLRHHYGMAGRGNCRIATALLIHGFDVPLASTGAFAAARENAHRMLDPVGIPLVCVATNWRTIACSAWDNEFGAGLAACLHQFGGAIGVGLVGSDEDYGHLALPWGSNPVTNPLLSSDRLRIQTDGGGYTRSEKVALLTRWPSFCANLRVCYRDTETGRNCGRCEKCVRTQLNFLAVGHPSEMAFTSEFHAWRVLTVRARNRVQIGYLREIHQMADRRGIRGIWRTLLRINILGNVVLRVPREMARKVRRQLAGGGWLRATRRWAVGGAQIPHAAQK